MLSPLATELHSFAPPTPGALEQMVREGVATCGAIASILPERNGLLPERSAASEATDFDVELEDGRKLLLKVLSGEGRDGFDDEVFQLDLLGRKAPFCVPQVIAHRKDGAAGPYTYVILSQLPGIPLEQARERLSSASLSLLEQEVGRRLARMHGESSTGGFHEVVPGPTLTYRFWPEFFARSWQQRIDELLENGRLDDALLDAVAWIHDSLPRILETNDVPRLVHGRLSGTKILCIEVEDGWGVSGFLEPALAYGHRELDLALLELSGVAGESFYEGYRAELPIDDGYELRKQVYMLYSVLDSVRKHGGTHFILEAVELVHAILRKCDTSTS